MRKILLFLTSFVLACTMMARQLTPDEALALAMGKLKAAQPERTRAMDTGINPASARLTHTEMASQDVPLLYVYNIAEGGFIIASADDRVSILLGYTDSGNFEDAKQNESFMAWLEDCNKALRYIGIMPEQTLSASTGTRALTTAVRPLLGEINWNQNDPYNLLTPMREGRPNAYADIETIHAPTGCMATAIAQVMKYYQWPVTGTGSHTNLCDSTQSIDFTQSTYQWSKMLPVYTGGESEESQMAVAQLMNDLGCALDMDYDYIGSGAWNYATPKVLADHFGYDKGMRFYIRRECSSEMWNDLLMTELNEQRPVISGGSAPTGGHAFVIDGYDINGLYHVNWGWGGRANGYFDINLMNPDYVGIGGFIGGYTIAQNLTIGVKPDVAGTSVAKPDVMMNKYFTYNEEEEEWSYKVSNYGLGDFTGETGLAMESPTGEVTKLTSNKYDEEPLGYYETCAYTFEQPEAPGLGYKLYIYYCDVIGGEMKRIPALYNANSTLLSVEVDGEYTWDYDLKETADVKVDSVEIMHNFVGFDPQFNITLSNSIASDKEYSEEIVIRIYTMVNGVDTLVCNGAGQAFIMPGESEEIVVKCSDVQEEFKGKIDAGEYSYRLYIIMGGTYYEMKTGTFEMVVSPPSEITYSDFDIDKAEFLPDEELTATMTVTNTGGYDLKTLMLVVGTVVEGKAVVMDVVQLRNVDIEADSTEIIKFKKVLSYEPGEYFVAFFVDGKQLLDAPLFDFMIVDPTTAIDNVVATPANDSKKGIYDLQGRPVQQMRKGGLYIIDGNKVLVK